MNSNEAIQQPYKWANVWEDGHPNPEQYKHWVDKETDDIHIENDFAVLFYALESPNAILPSKGIAHFVQHWDGSPYWDIEGYEEVGMQTIVTNYIAIPMLNRHPKLGNLNRPEATDGNL